MEKAYLLIPALLLLAGSVSSKMQIMHPKELKHKFGSNGTV
jgi:hypothetical protein